MTLWRRCAASSHQSKLSIKARDWDRPLTSGKKNRHAVVREIFIARLASDLRRPGAYTELWSKFKEKLKSFDGGDSGRTIMVDVLNRSGDWVPEYEPPSPVNKPSVRKGQH